MAKQSYNEASIQVLKGLEAVRKRPGMYIADTGAAGLLQLVREVIDNSIDEFQAGHCKNLKVEIWTKGEQKNQVRITDDGRGIPVGKHKETGTSTLTVVFCHLHAGGKFDNVEGGSYKTSSGLHGVGVKATNALSEFLEVTVSRDGKKYKQSFSRGLPTSEVLEVGKSKSTGTSVTFKHDSKIFGNINLDQRSIKERLVEILYLCDGLNITYEVDGSTIELKPKDSKTTGLKGMFYDYLKELNVSSIHKPIVLNTEMDIEDKNGKKSVASIELVFAWTQCSSDKYLSFVNVCRVPEGGTQVTGFRAGVPKAFEDLPAKIPKDLLRDGLVVVSHLRLSDPMFKSQSKDRLLNAEIRPVSTKAMLAAIKKAFKANPDLKESVINRAKSLDEANAKIRKMMDVVRNLDLKPKNRGVLPGKLAEAVGCSPTKRELYLVEGDSAGGTAKGARDSTFQEVLSLRGKVPNAVRAGPEFILKNKEYLSIIAALGVGISNVNGMLGEENVCDPKNKGRVRSGGTAKLCLLMDADPDGQHISSLIIAFLITYMKPLVDAGMVYIVDSPLFVGVHKDVRKQGHSKKAVLKQFPKGTKVEISRLKGHGSASYEQLYEYAFGPERKMYRLVVKDESDTDSVIDLMDADSSVRRRLLGV